MNTGTYNFGVQTFYGKGPQQLLRAGWRTIRGKFPVSSTTNRLNYCVIMIVYT